MGKTYAFLGAAVGGILLFEGIRGRNPIKDLKDTLAGTPLTDTSKLTGSAQSTAVADLGRNSSFKLQATDPTDLVQLTKVDGTPLAGQYLSAPAADAFERAQQMLGRDIPITSAWRSYASEAKRNESNPKRYPLPNYHTNGRAVDVWNDNGLPGWLEAPSQAPEVVQALTAVGFQRFDPTGGERMHWSFGGRG